MTPLEKSARETLLGDIESDVTMTSSITGRQTLGPRIRAAIACVARDAFVPQAWHEKAWKNQPLPIGHGQTISQPFIVAIMTELLDLVGQERVLEIGTGCGYQTAILAQCAAHVHTVELISELTKIARQTLTQLGFGNIDFLNNDGHLGWPEYAPYDAIMVTAAASRVPLALLEQLKPGGRMILPVSRELGWANQDLTLVTKDKWGTVTRKKVLDVAFVPLIEVGGYTTLALTDQSAKH